MEKCSVINIRLWKLLYKYTTSKSMVNDRFTIIHIRQKLTILYSRVIIYNNNTNDNLINIHTQDLEKLLEDRRETIEGFRMTLTK